MHSRELNPAAAEILKVLGDGHPAKIVKLACEAKEKFLWNLESLNVAIKINSISSTSVSVSVPVSVSGAALPLSGSMSPSRAATSSSSGNTG